MDYINERLSPQMEYYRAKCKKLRREYNVCSIIVIVVNAAIPVISMWAETCTVTKYIIAVASATATVLSSILLLRKTKEQWIEYRSTYEKLKREKVLYESGAGYYQTAGEKEFILKCEDIMDAEHGIWKEINSQIKK